MLLRPVVFCTLVEFQHRTAGHARRISPCCAEFFSPVSCVPWNHPCTPVCLVALIHAVAGPSRSMTFSGRPYGPAHSTPNYVRTAPGGRAAPRARCYVPALSEPPRLPAPRARVRSPTIIRDRVGHGCFWATASRDFLSASSRGALGGHCLLAATVSARYRPWGIVTSFRARTPSRRRSLREGTCPPLQSIFTLRAHLGIQLNALGQNRCRNARPLGPAVGRG